MPEVAQTKVFQGLEMFDSTINLYFINEERYLLQILKLPTFRLSKDS